MFQKSHLFNYELDGKNHILAHTSTCMCICGFWYIMCKSEHYNLDQCVCFDFSFVDGIGFNRNSKYTQPKQGTQQHLMKETYLCFKKKEKKQVYTITIDCKFTENAINIEIK